jgi:hypothetical protein
MQSEKYISDISNNIVKNSTNIVVEKNNNVDYDSDTEGNPIVPFWINNPNILFQQQYISEFFPIDSMTYEQKLNAITRSVILLTIIGFLFTNSIRLLLISCITIGAIFLVYYYHELEKSKNLEKKKIVSLKENFEGQAKDFYDNNNIPIPNNLFQNPESHNPFSNVLMSDYHYNPNKKPAPPSFNKNINEEILNQAKKTVMEANPDQPDIANKLFKDLGEELVFEQSLHQFCSNPGTTIPNDQAAFADFCYGSMVSCKEGNAFACIRNMAPYNLH